VIIMTVRCQAEIAAWMKSGDIDAWLFKPFRIGELGAMLRSMGLSSVFADRRHA
jgi:hypothetical protein